MNKRTTALLILLTLVFTYSCEAPRDRSALYKASSSNSPSTLDPTVPTTTTPSGTDSSTDATTNKTYPVSSTCRLSQNDEVNFMYNHNHIGRFSLCKSTENDFDFYFQAENSINDSQLCLIPTTTINSKSYYIGEPRCFMAGQAKAIYKITLLKNRVNFTAHSITGVLLMKDVISFYPAPFYQNLLTPDAFIYAAQWRDQTGDQSFYYAFESVGKYVYVPAN